MLVHVRGHKLRRRGTYPTASQKIRKHWCGHQCFWSPIEPQQPIRFRLERFQPTRRGFHFGLQTLGQDQFLCPAKSVD
uniref:Uncharacterized protein n=1 Tax=Rhizophora mucronata TaxID=61149 RepID=A0A2P2J104_RHIMU